MKKPYWPYTGPNPRPEAVEFVRFVERHLGVIPMPEEERDPAPPDDDDDTVGADWDEMGYWEEDGEEDDDDALA